MKYHVYYPDGSEVEIEVEPLSAEKLTTICVTVCFALAIVGAVLAIILH